MRWTAAAEASRLSKAAQCKGGQLHKRRARGKPLESLNITSLFLQFLRLSARLWYNMGDGFCWKIGQRLPQSA